ncbi:hypothetical protein [Candidatus Halocynthiibacter alkanivorans]|uniref:DsrE family protein n=1 Tax=Candidatus Halocynthiibacter alkanivorans TaxID=2267619 RepID=UPI0013572CD1|nr:hypothetical protein [Candidatus Halocynthiibacter alkanivorans]
MLKFTRSVLLTVALLLTGATASVADANIHRLALQISDNNPQKMATVLNVAANVSRHYSSLGEEVEIRIVAFNTGLHMLREDTSPVLDRLKSFEQSMPNVTFAACGNTLQAMAKKEGQMPPVVAMAEQVPAGVVDLMTLQEAGWTIIRP